MKSKGQTLVMFVILIPLIIMLAALIVDTGLMYKETARLKGVTKEAIKSSENILEVKEIYEENDIDTDNLEVEFNEGVRIKNNYEIDSIFGEIVGIKTYKIKVNMYGHLDNGEWKFEE